MHSILAMFTDPFDRQARLYPALLTLIPIYVFAIGAFVIPASTWSIISSAFVAFGMLYLFTNFSRRLGKRIEYSYFNKIGGKPTTILLRHSDERLNKITKARYHAFLSKSIRIALPTEKHEASKPQEADQIYVSAINWLLEQTRDSKKFSLLLKENIAYNFLRNSLGIKPIGISFSLLTIIFSLALLWVKTTNSTQRLTVLTFSENSGLSLSILFSVLMIVIWTAFFTENTMKQAAFTYAERLLQTVEHLAPTASKGKRPRRKKGG